MFTHLLLALALFAPQQDDVPVQDTSELLVDVDALAAPPQIDLGGWNTDIGGTFQFGAMWSNEVNLYAPSDLGGFTLQTARLWIDSELPDHWRLHFGVRGERNNPRTFFGIAGEAGPVRALDTYIARELNDDWTLTIGKTRPPFVSSALYDESDLLFFDRSFIGDDWDIYGTGAMLGGRVGVLRGWLAYQNGHDGNGQNGALTFRGLWDVVGGGAGQDREGAYDAPDGLALSIGGAIYYDNDTRDLSAQALEANLTLDRFAFAAEAVDNGDGLGSLYSWGLTASYMLTEELEIAGRAEDFSRADGTEMFRVGINKYLAANGTKWQASYSEADSHAPLASAGVFVFGLTLSF